MENILISGANGLIGTELTTVLQSEGYRVFHLVRKKPEHPICDYYLWNPDKKELSPDIFKNIDHVIHLAGENIAAKRWSKKQKEKLRISRIETANLIFQQSQNAKIKSFISASGISVYGSETTEIIYTEDAVPAHDFLAQLTVDWEKAADQFSINGTRVVKIRTSVVLSKKGGAMEKISRPIKMGFGCSLGSGKQYFPWIHINDLCKIYLKALRDENMNGAFNAVAPDHCTNEEFTSAVAKSLNKKIRLPNIPAFVLKIMFGEMSSVLLHGSRISSKKIIDAGMEFEFTNIHAALDATKG